MTILEFGFLAVISLSCSCLFKSLSSGVGYESWKSFLCGVFNLIFICIYMRVVDQGCVVFFECPDDRSPDYSLMAAIALISASLHAAAMPSGSDSRP